MKHIFVGNLGAVVSEESLRALFEPHGAVGRINIVSDPGVGQPLGFGFVEMPSDREGEKAIAAVNGTHLDGRTLNVSDARPKTDRWPGTRLEGVVLSVCGPLMRVAIGGCEDAAQFTFRGGQWLAEDGLPVRITFLSPFGLDGSAAWLGASASPAIRAIWVN